MENLAILLIVLTLFILVIVLGLLTLLVYKLLKQQPTLNQTPSSNGDEVPHPDISRSEFHPEVLRRMQEVEKFKPKRSDLFCPNHSEEPGEVSCAICDKLFCKSCIKPFKSLHFCKEHIPLIMRHDWDEVLTLKTSTSDPEQGVHLYEVKKKLLQDEDIPTYIETHYKINVDQDYIETYLVLFAMKEKIPLLKEKFKELIQPVH
ncbi:MAG: hypothetical protein ACLGHN_05170 [Bacteriovoracia bacterium]